MNELMTQAEMRRIQELSGIPSAQEEGMGDDLAFGAGKFVGKVQKGATDAMGKLRQGVSDLAANFQAGQQASQSGGPSDISTAPPGQGAQPYRSTDPSMKSMPPAPAPGGRGPKPSQPMPNRGQAAREDLDAMLRIAGLR